MKIMIMKQEVLDTLKANLQDYYFHYYDDETNDWIYEEFEEPFIVVDEIDDFALSELGIKKGQIDLNNCKIIYSKLRFLSPSKASDERLWAGLCHSAFYSYLRMRFDYTKECTKSPEKAADTIRSRFFFKGGQKSGMYRNTLCKCWWVGKLTYDSKNSTNPFWKLDVIGPNDISTKISDIFHNYSFIANINILNGIVEVMKYYNDLGKEIKVREHLRPALQVLNATGGSIILDGLTKDDVFFIMKQVIDSILDEKETNIDIEYIDEDEEEIEE